MFHAYQVNYLLSVWNPRTVSKRKEKDGGKGEREGKLEGGHLVTVAMEMSMSCD